MTANDRGHINNLSEEEQQTLKLLWKSFINRITDNRRVSFESCFESTLAKDFFYACALDNPDVIVLRWLRARKWDVRAALDQLIDALVWRSQWNVSKLLAEGEAGLSIEEMQTGKTSYIGFDKLGRPINYISARDHIKGQFTSESTEKLTVMHMEIGRRLLHYPIEAVTVIIDLEQFSMRNLDYQHVRFLINLLQNCYPESLGVALIINASRLFYTCWRIIKQWLDPVVEAKIRFLSSVDELTEFIDASNLPRRLNGGLDAFRYIPPREQEETVMSTIRDDSVGWAKATDQHREASINYLRITLEWADETYDQRIDQLRQQATRRLRDAYEQLLPYITTMTHYHRNGFIEDEIFHRTCRRIQQEKRDQIVQF